MKSKQHIKTKLVASFIILFGISNHVVAQSWNITGNAGIAAGTNYLGTKDPNDLVFRTNAIERGRVFGVGGAWRFGSSTNYAQIDSLGKLSFGGTGVYQVGGNKYAFQFSGNPNYGLFFNSTSKQYEFRNSSASPVFHINATTGATTIGAYTLPATDGAANQVLKTNGAGVLAWSADNNTTYTAGSGISISSNTITNTAPDQVVSVAGSNGISTSGSYPNFTISGAGLWKTTGNAGTSASSNFIGTTDAVDFVARTNNTERLRITSAGNIGIGTTTPSYKLEVYGSSYGIYGSASSYGVVGNGAYGLYGTGTSYGAYGYSSSGYGVAGSSGNVGVYGSGSNYGMYAVGGTYGLYGSGSTYGLYGNNSSSGTGVYGYSSSGYGTEGASGYVGVYGQGTSWGMYAYSGDGYGGEFSSYNSTGSYNTSSYGYGSYHYSYNNNALYAYDFNNSGYWAGFFNGDVYSSTGVYASSDQNLKQNIKDFSSAMSIINQLKPKQYDFKHDGIYSKMNLPMGSHYGLIAQDVEKILPNLVKNSKFDLPQIRKDGERPDSTAKKEEESLSFKSLNYTEFIPILIKGIQEQQQTINDLQQQINDLKTMVASLAQNKSVTTSSNTSSSLVNTATVSSATLEQNIPNPLSNSTTIRYSIPAGVGNAQLLITDLNGKAIKQIALQTGSGSVNIDASTLASGAYSYTLIVDGKQIATKKMVVSR